jgi:hypothetical protein
VSPDLDGDRPVSHPRSFTRLPLIIVLVATLVVTTFFVATRTRNGEVTTTTQPAPQYSLGVPNVNEPSGYGPLGAQAIHGFVQSYVQDFVGSVVPTGWDVFTGVPGGDPGGHFGAAHVSVGHGVLTLTTFKDPAYGGGWVTGGVCSCGFPQVYGAYFVRSRVTGSGPNEAQLLWPENDSWPPEIDFNESPSLKLTSATVHWSSHNHIQQWFLHANLSQWHTWGVIWTRREIVLTLDGHVWGRTTNAEEIPRVPMRLDLEQRTKCSQNVECPTRPTSMIVDWVEEYRPA